MAVKHILRYVHWTTQYGIWYPCDTSVDDRKSTTGYCYFIGKCLDAWHSKNAELCVTVSTAEVKYIVAGSCARLLWMKQTLLDCNVSQQCMPIMYDNSIAINISKYLVQRSCTKHNDIRHHFLQDHC